MFNEVTSFGIKVTGAHALNFRHTFIFIFFGFSLVDIRDQSLRLSEIAPNFGRFAYKNFMGPRTVVRILSCLPGGTSRGKVSRGYSP